jgi:hypothetical protein
MEKGCKKVRQKEGDEKKNIRWREEKRQTKTEHNIIKQNRRE